ncbi:hypothetical protein [Pedobacter arcticus]|uniref:hypothetical protein n=1 Tax=Pedobacter arcticus TaxID=752140 RepID=UPI00037890F4|nr:hypothetical protein [Pedobacter arcticus]
MKTKILSVLMFFALAFLSCKKDNDKVNFLTSKTWKLALVDKNTSTNPLTNPAGRVVYYAIQDFEKDDTFKFGADGKLTINRGALKSSADQQQTEIQNYSFNSTTQELTINTGKYTLAEQSEKQLKYYVPIAANGMSPQYLIYIFE